MDKPIQIKDMTSLAIRETVPVSVLVEVCYTCNEKCVHCFLEQHRQKGLSLSQYETLFDQMVEAGTFFVIFTGGDPFTRRDFIDIVRTARQRRLSVSIFTNGTLITEAQADELKRLWIEEVHISIYSADPATHDAITGVPGSFTKSLQTLQMLLTKGIQTRIKCPLIRDTASHKTGVKQLADELGVWVQFSTVITAKNDGDAAPHQLRLTPDQLKELVMDPDVGSHTTTPIRQDDTLQDSIPCETIFNGGAIDPFGDVYPCNQWRVKGGNVLETPFGEIWQQAPAFNALRQMRLRDLQACATCTLASHCARCPGLAHLEDGSHTGCSSIARLHAELRQEQGIYPQQEHIFSTR